MKEGPNQNLGKWFWWPSHHPETGRFQILTQNQDGEPLWKIQDDYQLKSKI